ncbi:hypothetical protein CRE_14959 [Caenorhabditis remanei]|uniref:Uncharacterized protein n=1 Tax=Caenorhabditis remanei TaxID=31234 RepID=E3NBX6_CAERE|nr:hypothetical protein CRE_14959 [Caenorhabditis remanei]
MAGLKKKLVIGALSTTNFYFKKYIRCTSHSVNLIGANGVNPL